MLLDSGSKLEAERYIDMHLRSKQQVLLENEFEDFRFRTFDRDFIRTVPVVEMVNALSTFSCFTGRSCSGKSFLVKQLRERWPNLFVQLPEVMTRKPRVGEIEGVDLIHMGWPEFERRVSLGEFYLAYEFGEGKKRKGVGILKSSLVEAIYDPRIKLLIADPYELCFFLPDFWQTRCVLVLVDSGTYLMYRYLRGGVELPDQCGTGVREDEFSYLPWGPLTKVIWNHPEETDGNIEVITQFLTKEL